MPYNVTSRYGFSTEFYSYKGKDTDETIENHLPTDSRSKNHSILQPMDKMRNSNFPYGVSRLSTAKLVDLETKG